MNYTKMKISKRKHYNRYCQGISMDFEDFIKYREYLGKNREVKSTYSELGNSYYIYLSNEERDILYPLLKEYISGNRSYDENSKTYLIINNFEHSGQL